jgi:hypothetical protein
VTDFLYATVSEIKERLYIQDTERDRAWLDVARGASRWVEEVLGHRFYSSADLDPDNPTETRYYEIPPYENPLVLEVDDLLSVTTLQSDPNGDGTFDYTWTVTTDYWLGPRNALARGKPYSQIHKASYAGRYWFPSYPNSVKVVGNFGYCTLANVPAGVKQLTLIVAEVTARPLLDLTMAGVNSYQVGPELRVTMDAGQLPPMAQKLIETYREPVYIV